MRTPKTDLPIVHFDKIPDAKKLQILREIFLMVEYDEDDKPGADRSAGDIGEYTVDILTRNGVIFSHPDRLPHGYRFNRHTRPDGTGCGWSYCSVFEPMARKNKGSTQCPDGCPDSIVEADPDATHNHDGRVNVEPILTHLNVLGIATRTEDTGGGTYTVFVGDGRWDSDAERYTHPISIGPCEPVDGRLTADPFEVSYGLQGDHPAYSIDAEDDPAVVARRIVRLLWEKTGDRAA